MSHINELDGFISCKSNHIYPHTSSHCHKSVTKCATLLGIHQCISENNHEVTKWLISDHPLHPLCSIHPSFIISDLIISDVIFDHFCLTSKFQSHFFIRKTIRREKVHEEVQSHRLINESVIDIINVVVTYKYTDKTMMLVAICKFKIKPR